MSGRNGIAGRRGGRETPSAPVSDERAACTLARLFAENAALADRAKRAEAEARKLRKRVRLLEARLDCGRRIYRKGRITAKRAAEIMAEEGWKTQDGNPPTARWIYRVNSGEILPPLWFPEGLKCSEDSFRVMVIEAVAEQREMRRRGHTRREAVWEHWNT